MCPEIVAMKGRYQKDADSAPVNKKRWSKSKRRTFLHRQMGKVGVQTCIGTVGEMRQRTRAWPARRSHQSPDPVDDSVPSGAMAPENTTQYLMDLAYTELDVLMEAYNVSTDSSMLSHDRFDESAFSMSDFDYDRSLDFQQRDFENMLSRNEI